MSINEMFQNENSTSVSARALNGTAQLTAYANDKALELLKLAESDIENYRGIIQASTTDIAVLDQFISNVSLDTEVLADRTPDELMQMLKSQQSKRSRCKSKQMTMDNYRALLSAAIAEAVIRLILGREKNRHVGAASKSLSYTPEQFEQLANDQEALRKEIRNVQSKKSIYKGRPDFDEASERWQMLLKLEQQLKDLRENNTTDHTKSLIAELLGEVDINSIDATDAKELLLKIRESSLD